MKIEKKYIESLLIFIHVCLIIVLTNIIGYIPSNEVKLVIVIILSLIGLMFYIRKAYRELKTKQFTTTACIVVIDFIEIIVFLFVGYNLWENFCETNIEVILYNNNIYVVGTLILLFTSALQEFLKNKRFLKKV